MAVAGATAIVLHHTGKSPTSKISRGGSSFPAGVDAGWLVEGTLKDCAILNMTLTAWRSRIPNITPQHFRMVDGRPVPSTESREDLAMSFVLRNLGKTQDAIEKAARNVFPRDLIRAVISKGKLGKKLQSGEDKKLYLYGAVPIVIGVDDEVDD